MKATGIVRRIDDLGRIAIPKEIRRSLGIHENEPLEIFVDTSHEAPMVCFMKYVPNYSDSLAKLREEIISEMADCDENELASSFAKAMRIAEEACKQFEQNI